MFRKQPVNESLLLHRKLDTRYGYTALHRLDRDDSDGGVSVSDTDTHGDANAYAYAYAHAGADADANADTHSDTHSDTHADAHTHTDGHADTGGRPVLVDHREHADVGGELRCEHVYLRVDDRDE